MRVGLTASACSSVGKPACTAASCGPVSVGRMDMRACTSWLCSRMASSRPHERKISIVRVLIPEALGKIDVPGWRSTISEDTPWRARPMAVARPAGPAPTTRTGNSWGCALVVISDTPCI